MRGVAETHLKLGSPQMSCLDSHPISSLCCLETETRWNLGTPPSEFLSLRRHQRRRPSDSFLSPVVDIKGHFVQFPLLLHHSRSRSWGCLDVGCCCCWLLGLLHGLSEKRRRQSPHRHHDGTTRGRGTNDNDPRGAKMVFRAGGERDDDDGSEMKNYWEQQEQQQQQHHPS